MNKSAYRFLIVFIFIIVLTIFEIIYYGFYSHRNSRLIDIKRKSVALTKLPDLALCTETIWIRHRSITSIFSIFPEDGTLLEYYPSSFVYNIHLQKKLESKNKR